MSNTPSRQYIYRMYDANGALLYVGVSSSALRRMAEHKDTQPWFDQVARVDIERHECTRKWIAAEEKRVIQAENPQYNKAHNGNGSHTAKGSSWLNVGRVYAFGLRNGECYVGMIAATSRDDPTVPSGHILIDDYNFMLDCFGERQSLIKITDMAGLLEGEIMSEPTLEALGYVVWDIEPLGQFQTKWEQRHGRAVPL